MKLTIFLGLLALAGCTSYLVPADFQLAEQRCADNGGVEHMAATPGGGWIIYCNNTAVFHERQQ